MVGIQSGMERFGGEKSNEEKSINVMVKYHDLRNYYYRSCIT